MRPPHEFHVRDRIVVPVHGRVTVAEIQSPNADRFIGPGARQQRPVVGGIQRERGELVPVQAQIEFEAVVEEYVHLGIEGGDEHHPLGRSPIVGLGDRFGRRVRVSDGDDVVGHLEGAGVLEFGTVLVVPSEEIPEFDRLVGAPRHNGDALALPHVVLFPLHLEAHRSRFHEGSLDVEAPYRAVVRILLGVDDVAAIDVEDQQVSLPRPHRRVGVAGKKGRAQSVAVGRASPSPAAPVATGRQRQRQRTQARPIPDVPHLGDVLGHAEASTIVRAEGQRTYSGGMPVHIGRSDACRFVYIGRTLDLLHGVDLDRIRGEGARHPDGFAGGEEGKSAEAVRGADRGEIFELVLGRDGLHVVLRRNCARRRRRRVVVYGVRFGVRVQYAPLSLVLLPLGPGSSSGGGVRLGVIASGASLPLLPPPPQSSRPLFPALLLGAYPKDQYLLPVRLVHSRVSSRRMKMDRLGGGVTVASASFDVGGEGKESHGSKGERFRIFPILLVVSVGGPARRRGPGSLDGPRRRRPVGASRHEPPPGFIVYAPLAAAVFVGTDPRHGAARHPPPARHGRLNAALPLQIPHLDQSVPPAARDEQIHAGSARPAPARDERERRVRHRTRVPLETKQSRLGQYIPHHHGAVRSSRGEAGRRGGGVPPAIKGDAPDRTGVAVQYQGLPRGEFVVVPLGKEEGVDQSGSVGSAAGRRRCCLHLLRLEFEHPHRPVLPPGSDPRSAIVSRRRRIDARDLVGIEGPSGTDPPGQCLPVSDLDGRGEGAQIHAEYVGARQAQGGRSSSSSYGTRRRGGRGEDDERARGVRRRRRRRR
mmetsp:Transcript_6469/g.19053  ORF Transcript_6469/g.19053 Transcript_6469/m.19053 type:complete len:816 (-) Transcript_6469:194-2641(-)